MVWLINASSLAVITVCQCVRRRCISVLARKLVSAARAPGASAPAGSSAAMVITCGSFSANKPVSVRIEPLGQVDGEFEPNRATLAAVDVHDKMPEHHDEPPSPIAPPVSMCELRHW
jgi:hypothetical protein